MKKFATILFFIFYSAFCLANLSIGIIGAGDSGLIAADELTKKGYDVVVLEATGKVGGKVRTILHDGLPYEMGAVITAPDYEIVLGIAEELNLDLTPTPESIACGQKGELCPMLSWSREKYGWTRFPKLGKDFIKFGYYVMSHRDFFEPGFEHTPIEMHQTFEKFAQHEGIDAVLETFRPVMVGCGYGYAESMPAAYWMKLMKTFGYEYPMSFFGGKHFYHSFTGGWQALWEKFAAHKGFDIRLNTGVTKIERGLAGGKIKLHTNNGDFIFDKVINTVPHLSTFLLDNMTAEENEIFSQVRTLPYKVTLAEIDGLPTRAHLWLRENSYRQNSDGQPNDGKPVLISSNQDTNIYQIYQFTEMDKTDTDFRILMEETIRNIGGTLRKVIREETFSYFPHFAAESFQNDIPNRLIGLQGKDGLYYTGALMNFETVELSAQHARALVKKYF